MSQYKNANALEKLTLGKNTEYASQYNAALLQGVPRRLNRDSLSLDENTLPFMGEDVWYGYEISWLNAKGKPIVRVAEFSFPCTSENIIESKSFKLYLNSFNQTTFSSEQEVKTAMKNDLSAVCGAQANVILFPVDKCPALEINTPNARCLDELDIEMHDYQLSSALLNTESDTVVSEVLVSHLLKSNCLITNQPDWASLFISYKGKKINHSALLKYIISFREHNEFHEQCVERIFCDLMTICQPEALTVYARYTRRGGLDINPFRSTHESVAPKTRTLRQ
ncbi:NADPH-dependent 7-cyano-7-deazaguanine reductase QueF [Thalassotalea hakodatensis]|uniref:NADPH-dependent 7-cyano-7-deazaguanine reductase QueF n=1 Tax=Thalassotalea hakodatensis TaxID=3030492 RepID=UPI002573F1D6|nr:NADPH-dependent 7-cyano-7-deazaguanine reductase QueF [Thalassotalea hakodatensis]